MQTYNNSVVLKFDNGTTGNADSGAPVTVRFADVAAGAGALATIYDNQGIQILNPLTTDLNGNYTFKVDAGTYDIVIREGDANKHILQSVVIGTPGIFNILEYGAVGDGVVDNNTAIQAAVDAAIAYGGGLVFIPAGRFRRANNDAFGVKNTTISCIGDNITVAGVGKASVIFHDDRIGEDRADLIRFEGNGITLKDFCVQGTASDFVIPTGFSQSLTGSGCNNLIIQNITVESVHYMAMTFTSSTDVSVTGCRLLNVVRDGYRFTAGRNIRIIGNYAKNVADDVVAIHSIDSSRTTDSIIVTGNTFEHCQSMKFLGAKNLIVQGNTMRRCIRTAIWIANDEETEGNTNMFNIDIRDNIILDAFSVFGSNAAIYIQGRSVVGGGAVTVNPYSQNYLNDIDKTTGEFMPIQRLTIANNVIARTLPDATDYSDYGFGQFFDRVTEAFGTPTTSYFRAQEITASDFNTYSIRISAAVRDLHIENNLFGGHRLSAIRLIHTNKGTPLTYENCIIRNNTFKNVGRSSGNAIVLEDGGTANPNSSAIEIIENTFDGDPYFLAAGHNADNTWAGDDNFTAIKQTSLGFLNNVLVSKNTFRNVSQTGILVNSNIRTLEPNIIYSDYTSASSSGNKGVRIMPEPTANIYVKIDGDPTSATFNEVVHFPEMSAASTSFPLTGFWPYGHYIKNRAPAPVTDPSTGLYIVTGWVKGSTNNNGAVNQNSSGFYELRSFVQNIA